MDVFRRREGNKSNASSRLMKPISLVTIGCFTMLVIVSIWGFAPFSSLFSAHASNMVKLPGQLPALVKTSQITTSTNTDTSINVTIGLRLRNQDGLANYVKSVSRAKDATKRTLTAAQLTMAYSPLPASQQAVIDYMQQYGFSTTKTFSNHVLIGFQGTIGEAEQAFGVQISNYRSPSGETFYAPTTDLNVPAALAPFIQSVSGLDTANHLTHTPISRPVSKTVTKSQSASVPAAATATNYCQTTSTLYYTPSQLVSGYNLTSLYNQGFYGEGQTVGLIEFSDYKSSDISAYTAACGGSSVPITRVVPQGATTPPQDAGAIEANLDIELVASAAPHLAGIRVYEAPNTAADSLLVWEQIVNDAVPVVSTSWGVCEANLSPGTAQSENSLLLVAAAQGQSIFAAAGDAGSDACYPTNTGNLTQIGVQDPASQPYVTGIGGTTLTLNGSSYSSETAWNNPPSSWFYPAAGGGGISSLWTIPSWQQAPGVPGSNSSATPCAANTGNTGANCREVPDVSLFAGGGNQSYLAYCTVAAASCDTAGGTASWVLAQGTSAAAPMWAAMTALANQKSPNEGYFNLGFLNPMLYQIAQNSSEYSTAFHDVKTGNNNINGGTTYTAGTGYDMATGLGSYNAANLANDLISLAATSTGARNVPANTIWYFAEGAVGGSFQEYLTVLNPSPTQPATVKVQYLFEGQPEQIITHTAPANARSTINVNTDLGVSPTAATVVSVSAIVTSSIPVVVERPMYFKFDNGLVPSGTDVFGATNDSQQTFYFAEGDERQNGTQYYATYITILNPSTTQTANVTVNYYAQGALIGSKVVAVGPLQRGTTTPSDAGVTTQAAIEVISDTGVVVERPMYFKDNISTAGGVTTGAASAVGATSLGGSAGSDWLFAEGYTASDFQEYLILANFTSSDTTASVKLEYSNGQQQTVAVKVNAHSQYYFDVNNAYSHPVGGITPTSDVSAEVTAPTASIVAERLMYFHYLTKIVGGTDVVGQAGPSSQANYSFAEGYAATNFYDFITLQNPNTSAVNVVVTLYANGTVVQKTLKLAAQSRSTVNVDSLVVPMAAAYSPHDYNVSATVQALNGTVVAERPLYFIYSNNGATGASAVLGYTGG